jgi:hypothetical protein
MSTKWQAVLSVAVVLMAGGAVAAYAAFGEGGPGPQEMEGHVHGAGPAAGDELTPVHLDPDRERRIGVTYAVAELKEVERTLRTVATVTYDETRVAYVSPRIHGWVERIHADFLGPLSGRETLWLSCTGRSWWQRRRSFCWPTACWNPPGRTPKAEPTAMPCGCWNRPGSGWSSGTSLRTRWTWWRSRARPGARWCCARRSRASWWRRMSSTGPTWAPAAPSTPSPTFPACGRKARCSRRIWAWSELGQAAHIRLEAYPGEMFHGRVSYIYPTVSAATRTGRIRVELDNRDGRLRPGMYAEVQLDVPASGLRVVVPRTAVLMSGERDIVFVRSPDGMLVPREVTLGLSAGREVEILAGIEPGEVVVSSAGFLIDAESNLGAAMETPPRHGGRYGGGSGSGGRAPRGARRPGAGWARAGWSRAGHEAGTLQVGHEHDGWPWATTVNHASQNHRVVGQQQVPGSPLRFFRLAGGIIAISRTPLEAIPDLSDVQVIVQAEYPGQAPLIVEDQVTYPIAAEMLKVPGARVVRGYSFFGLSFVYVIFQDGTDIYWARSRVLEYLSGIQDQLPDDAQTSLGPDATGLGWVFQYVLEDTLGPTPWQTFAPSRTGTSATPSPGCLA